MVEDAYREDLSRHASRRLESWKEIAAYLRRDVRTVQRWERRDGLPVHRLQHSKLGSVFSYTSELDAWREARDPTRLASPNLEAAPPVRRRAWIAAAIAIVALVTAIVLSRVGPSDPPAGASFRIRSLAVLPLDDVSQDTGHSYFADGMTDALITRLSTLRDVRMIARTSVAQFKGTRKSVPEIAGALKVDAVLEGSVLRSGDRVRVSVQLVRGDTGVTVWSGAYERAMGDVLGLQSEVADVIASQLVSTVTPAERARLVATRTVAPPVYESYLKGLFYLNGERGSIQESVRYFEEATAGDPTFAPALVGLAVAYQALGSTSVGVLPVAEAQSQAVALGHKALQLDPQLAKAHAILARADQQEWRWTEAEAAYRHALEIDSNDAEIYSGFAHLLVFTGQAEQGIAYARRARELDPLAVERTVQLAWLLYHTRQFDEAIRELRTVLSVHRDRLNALWFLGFALIDSSQVDEGVETLEHLVAIGNRNPAYLGLLARAYGSAGRRADAHRLIDELRRRGRGAYVPPAPFVHAYIGIGDRDNAFASLERAYRERSNIVQTLKTHPLYDQLRDDRRFADLLRRVGLD